MKEEQHKVRETGHPEWIRKAAGTDARDVRDSSDSTIPARDSNRYVFENYHASYSAIMDASILPRVLLCHHGRFHPSGGPDRRAP